MHQFIVMNECNQPLFVNPQWGTPRAQPVGRDLRPGARRGLRRAEGRQPLELRLGRRPLAARQRRAERASNSSTTPVKFLGSLGAWFKAFAAQTHRTAPLMDGLDFHPYPVPQSLSFATGYAERARCEHLEPFADLPGLLQRVHRHAAAHDRPADGRRTPAEPERDGDPDRRLEPAGLRRPGGERQRRRRDGRPVRDRGLPGDATTSRCSSCSLATRTSA